jgi:ribosome-associated translation inhibitor RaiA
MPLSVHYRHGTKNKSLKSFVQNRCETFLDYYPEVSNLKVVLDKQHISKNASTHGVCHISVRAPGKVIFEIFEEHSNAWLAFEKAIEAAINLIIRSYLFKCKRNNQELEDEQD